MKKLILFYLFAVGLPASTLWAPGCGRPCEEQCHLIRNLKLESLDNSGPVPPEMLHQQVLAKALILRLSVQDSLRPELCASGLGLFTVPAFAARAYCPVERTRHLTRLWTISSDENFDAAHPAGSSLNDLFYLRDSAVSSANGTYEFYLLQEPAAESVHRFQLTLFFPGYDTLTTITGHFKLLKK